jgi:putative SOS response-associated peptidase YedK
VVARAHWETWLDVSADVGFLLGPESADGFQAEPASALATNQ